MVHMYLQRVSYVLQVYICCVRQKIVVRYIIMSPNTSSSIVFHRDMLTP
jgi:hypothetical protein